jgi:hypothetical protein
VAFQCRGAWHKIFVDRLGIVVWGASEEAGVDGAEEGCDGRVAQTLVHEFNSICFDGAVVQEHCECGHRLKWGLWGMTFTGAGS